MRNWKLKECVCYTLQKCDFTHSKAIPKNWSYGVLEYAKTNWWHIRIPVTLPVDMKELMVNQNSCDTSTWYEGTDGISEFPVTLPVDMKEYSLK